MNKLNKVIEVIESMFRVDEIYNDGYLMGYEINTYTPKGVNKVISLDYDGTKLNPYIGKDLYELFSNYVDNIDIDDEISNHMQNKEYKKTFTYKESVEDLELWVNSLINLKIYIKEVL